MDIYKQLEAIKKGEITSRINSYVIVRDVGESIDYFENKNYEYIDFETIAEEFFISTKMTLNIFDTGKFFKYIKNLLLDLNENVVIGNLEIIQNILYNKESNSKYMRKFFNEFMNQTYKKQVYFIISDIKKMKIERELKESFFPEKNIIYWNTKEIGKDKK